MHQPVRLPPGRVPDMQLLNIACLVAQLLPASWPPICQGTETPEIALAYLQLCKAMQGEQLLTARGCEHGTCEVRVDAALDADLRRAALPGLGAAPRDLGLGEQVRRVPQLLAHPALGAQVRGSAVRTHWTGNRVLQGGLRG